MIAKGFTEPTERIKRLKKAFVAAVPEVESERAVLVTESYRETEGMPILIRRAKALERILNHLPIVIRDDELVVGVITKNLRSAQIYPEFSFEWVEKEFDTMDKRSADPFKISEAAKSELKEAFKYWKGKTTSDCIRVYVGGYKRSYFQRCVYGGQLFLRRNRTCVRGLWESSGAWIFRSD